jgi:hypothetical protein
MNNNLGNQQLNNSDGGVVEDDFVHTSLPLPPSPLARFSSPNPFSSLCDEVDPTSMDHDANGVAVPFERSTSVQTLQRKVRTRKSQRPSKVDDSSPLPSAPPVDDSVSIASGILGTPSIDAYEGGDEEDGGSDNMEPSIANDNEYPITYPKMDQNLAWLRKMILGLLLQLKFHRTFPGRKILIRNLHLRLIP